MSIKERITESAEAAFAQYIIARLRRGRPVSEMQLIEAALILQWQIEQIELAMPNTGEVEDVLQRSVHRAPR